MLHLDGETLRIHDVARAATRSGLRVEITPAARDAMRASRELKRALIDERRPIYGVTTGFGASVTRQISPQKAAQLQLNMIRYHLNGTGAASPEPVVRATLLIRANCLARGHSAINPAVVDRLLDLLRWDVLPVIPARGSVGASGDLVPLCYVAAAVIGEGEVSVNGAVRPAGKVFAEHGWRSIQPEAKDALALLNGTSFSAAWGALALARAETLAVVADVCTAMASEALLGNRGHFDLFIHGNKPHPGQLTSALAIRELLDGSALALAYNQVIDLNDPLGDRDYQQLRRNIQDRYSIRCAPGITGVLRDTLSWAGDWLETEINSSTDNPLFDVAGGRVHSGGNFYGGHLVHAMDSLNLALAGVGDMLDRQLELLVDEKYNNGLTPNLIPWEVMQGLDAGLHHGFKGMQIAASALAAEALHLAAPVSVHSRSTEAHNQDKVSMAPIAARGATEIADLVGEVAAIHLLAACQALDLRGVTAMSPRTRAVHALIRDHVPPLERDRRMDADIHAVAQLIRDGSLIDTAMPATGVTDAA